MRSGPEPFDSPDAQALCAAQQAEMLALYVGEADLVPPKDPSKFTPPDGVFVIVRDGGRAVACGGLCRHDETSAEIKRMYAVPEARGRGLGRRILEELEEHARAFGYEAIRLETGDQSTAAIGLYTSAGFERTRCWPPYDSRSLSLCFAKRLEAST
jgi:putative acetyltransferase